MSDSSSRASTPPLEHRQVRGTEPGVRETTLFDGEGVLVTSARVVAGGRTWPLGEVEGVDSVRRGPHVLPWLVTLLVGVLVGLPSLFAAMATAGSRGQEIYDLALAGAGAAIFGSIAALLMMGDTYWLVLRTRQRDGRVLGSRDPQLISSLVAVVAQAAAAARQKH